MILNGRCQIFNNGELVNYDITSLSSFSSDPISDRCYSDYKGTVSKKDLDLLTFNEHGSVFVFITNEDTKYYGKIIEYSQCTIKKRYPYKLHFLSKSCQVILHITEQNKTKIHESDKIFRRDKIDRIIFNI